ncbi:MAG TPA: glycosyltransferase family 2 protein [Candidatus Nitrosocosmicus sp.]|nr:glycosyltransferase family 2 protein [Candidatus Nitrosocosmicus sp.]
MNKRGITIGIITYNEQNNILKFFDSLKSQHLGEKVSITEVIFVDDSNDETPILISKIRSENPEFNIRLIHNHERKGASQGWNTIFKNAKGSIIVLLDADIEIEKNCILRLSEKISDSVGLCASNTVPQINTRGLYACASVFIGYWLRSIRMKGLSQYTTMGRALSLDTELAREIEIPQKIIAIDLYLQCKVLEKNKNVIYDDDAIVYFNPPVTKSDFFSQIVRALVGHGQIKELTRKFDFDAPVSLTIREFFKNSIKYPKGSLCLLLCYLQLPVSYLKDRERVSHTWEPASSTKM